MDRSTFFQQFDKLGDAPNAVAKMRELVLQLAVRGRLVEQVASDGVADIASLNLDDDTLVQFVKAAPHEIPASWKWLPIELAFEPVSTQGRKILTSEINEIGKHPVVDQGKMLIRGYTDRDDQLIQLRRPVVVFGDHTREVKYIDFAFVAGADGTKILAPKDFVHPRYLYWCVRSYRIEAREYGRHYARLLKSYFPLCPLAEQKRIVAKVDELMALCDELETRHQTRQEARTRLQRSALHHLVEAREPQAFATHWRRVRENFHLLHETPDSVAELRKTILQLALQGKLVPQDPNDEPASQQLEAIRARKAELVLKQVIKKSDPSRPVDPNEVDHDIPVSWAWVRLVEICELITDGTHLTPKYTESGRMFLSAQNVKPFKFMPAKHRFVSEEDYQGYVKNRKPQRGDVLLTRVGAGIGEAATIDQDLDFAIYVSLGLVRPVRGFVFSDFITLWLNSPDGTEKSSRNTYGKGVSQGNLNLSLIRNFLVPLPPLAEQRRIVAKVDELMRLCDELENKLAQSNTIGKKLIESTVQHLLAS